MKDGIACTIHMRIGSFPPISRLVTFFHRKPCRKIVQQFCAFLCRPGLHVLQVLSQRCFAGNLELRAISTHGISCVPTSFVWLRYQKEEDTPQQAALPCRSANAFFLRLDLHRTQPAEFLESTVLSFFAFLQLTWPSSVNNETAGWTRACTLL